MMDYVLKKRNMWRAVINYILKGYYFMFLDYSVFCKRSWQFTYKNETKCVESYDRLRTQETESVEGRDPHILNEHYLSCLAYSVFSKKS